MPLIQTLRALRADADVRAGARAMRGAGLGIAAWGLVTGVAMVKSGLGLWLALAMTLFVYAGSAQLAALPLIAAAAPLPLVLGAAFCVNLRFVVFSAQVRPYLEGLPRWQRTLAGYLNGDVVIITLLRRYPVSDGSAQQRRYFLGAAAMNWLCWQLPSLGGVLLADRVPDSWGLGFAGTLALLAIILGQLADRATALVIVLASTLSTALFWLPLRLNVVTAIVVSLLVGMAWDAWRQEHLTVPQR